MQHDHREHERHDLAIGALTGHLENAWNRNDGAAYASVFTDDSDYIAFDGTHVKGRAANAAHHQRLFDSVLRGSRLKFEHVTVRLLTPEVALMHGDGAVLMPWHSEVVPKRRSLQTFVVVKDGNVWRIAAFHNVRVRPLTLPGGVALTLLLAFFRLRTALAAHRRHDAPAMG